MDFQLQTADGRTVSLAEMMGGKKSLIVFLRHLGWPICQDFLAQLREHADTIQGAGVKLITIVPTTGEQIGAFFEAFGTYPFPVLGDPEQTAYTELGHKHMSRWMLIPIAFRLMTGKLELFKKDPKQNEVVKKAIRTQDTMQQGGTWLISPSGEVLWSHLDDLPQNHATIEEILKQIRK